MTKRYSFDKAMMLERSNFILEKQIEQMRFKLFILEEQKRQYEEYSTYLEETLSIYKADEKLFEDINLELPDGCFEIEEKKYEKEQTVAPVLIQKKDNYSKCFYCMREYGKTDGYVEDYTTHLIRCQSRKFMTNCYQNELVKCNLCHGAKVVFEEICLNVDAELYIVCNACNNKHKYDKNKCKKMRKHVKNHRKKSFSFICECTDNFVLKSKNKDE